MKTYNKPSISKLVNRFDNELKNLLLEDLKAVRATKNQILESIKQTMNTNNGLSAA
jgi:hypothetical protein